MADALPIFAFFPHKFWIKIVLHRQAAKPNKLYYNRYSRNCPVIFNIGKITRINVNLLR